jgi:peptidoglycan-associated lipoprotein
MKMLRYEALALSLMLVMAGCAKTVKPTPPPAAPAPAPTTMAAPAAATTQAPAPAQVSPLDDPSSVLAQRVIYFDFDKSNIRSEFLDTLTAHAKYLIANPNQKMRIEGYTDERGTVEYNISLGDRRAQAVRRFLLFQGVAPDQLTTVSYGEAHPADAGHDEAAWAKNRRAVLVYLR